MDPEARIRLQAAELFEKKQTKLTVKKALLAEGVDEKKVADIVESGWNIYQTRKANLRSRNRAVGVVIMIVGLILNIYTIFFIEGWIIIVGIFVFFVFAGFFVIIDPDLLSAVPQYFENRSKNDY